MNYKQSGCNEQIHVNINDNCDDRSLLFDVKSLDELLNELKDINLLNEDYTESIPKFIEIIGISNESYLLPSRYILSLQNKTINNWNGNNITTWSKEIKMNKEISTNNNQILPEVIAVIQRGVLISESYLPRDIQLITVLSLLLKNPIKGRLAQVYTGEGKSLIMAMLAVILALKGKKVDIVTSSKVLAIREKTRFYSLFGLSVSNNCANSKACYKANIVYGDTLNYVGDILSDEYRKYNTRKKRPFHLVIVDEVDNLFIDNRLSQTKLSSKTPGMSALTPILQIIWIIVNNFYIYQENRNILSDKLAMLYLMSHQVAS